MLLTHLFTYWVCVPWCVSVCVCVEDTPPAGGDLSNMRRWLWSLGSNDWFRVPGILALGRLCPRQCTCRWQCYHIPHFRSSCSGVAQLCGLHCNAEQCYTDITLHHVICFFIIIIIIFLTFVTLFLVMLSCRQQLYIGIFMFVFYTVSVYEIQIFCTME